MKPRDFGMLVTLGAIWGSSYVFIRLAAPALGAVVLAAVRVLLACAFLGAYALIARQKLVLRARWKRFLLLGLVNVALPFVLIGNAVTNLNSSIAAILNSTTPLFTALVAAVWLRDALTARKAAGLAFGLTGVIVLVGWSPLPLTATVLIAVMESLLGALCYGIGNVYAKAGFAGVPALSMAFGQQLAAGLILLPLAAVSAPAAQPTPISIAAAVALGLLCTALAYLLYFRLMTNVGPTHTSTVTFLVPFFSLLWSGLFLGETISASMLVGLAFILTSITLVTGMRVSLRRAC